MCGACMRYAINEIIYLGRRFDEAMHKKLGEHNVLLLSNGIESTGEITRIIRYLYQKKVTFLIVFFRLQYH